MSIFPCPWRRLSASKPAKRSVIGKRLRVCLSSHCQLLAARQRGQCRLPQERGAQWRWWQGGERKKMAAHTRGPQAANLPSPPHLLAPQLSQNNKKRQKNRQDAPTG